MHESSKYRFHWSLTHRSLNEVICVLGNHKLLTRLSCDIRETMAKVFSGDFQGGGPTMNN